ncbi:MAG: 30S ribosomal protein S16, partial [Bacteroidota bacterium]|nr:30S ribosomal protein S16 [Bacteroidota bacterium]
NGVKKGALTNEQAEEKFAKWLSEKEAKIENKITSIAKEEDSAIKAKLASEKEKSEARAAALAEVVAEDTAAETTEEPAAETTEEPAAETTEEPAAEATEEPATEDSKEAEK